MAERESNRVTISRKEAKARGLTFYFTGKPCKVGHVSIRVVSSEQCRQCSLEKSAQRYKEKRDVEIKRMRVRYWSNRNRELEWAKGHYRKNVKRLREKARKWRERNPALVKEVGKRYYQQNRTKSLLVNKSWYANNPNSKIAYRNKRRARKRHGGGSHTSKDVLDILKAQNFRCAYCRKMIAEKKERHVDHIVPLAKGGSSYRKNIQLLCAACNIAKRDHDPIDHMRSLGFLL